MSALLPSWPYPHSRRISSLGGNSRTGLPSLSLSVYLLYFPTSLLLQVHASPVQKVRFQVHGRTRNSRCQTVNVDSSGVFYRYVVSSVRYDVQGLWRQKTSLDSDLKRWLPLLWMSASAAAFAAAEFRSVCNLPSA